MIIAICGEEKTWKTTMALSFPTPLFHLDLDVGGFDRAKWRIPTDNITSKSYPIPIQIEKLMGAQKQGVSVRFPKKVMGYKEAWQSIVVDFVEACQNPEMKSIVIDSSTQLWLICHTSLLQEKQEIQLSIKPGLHDADLREKLQPIEFPNERMRSLIYTARSCKKNLILTHYPRDIYSQRVTDKGVEEYKTGETTVDGFKDTQKLVDLVVWLELKQNNKTKKYETHARITKCGLEGLGTEAVGLEVEPSYEGIVNLQKAMKGE